VDLAGNRVATYENTDYGEVLVDEGSVYNPYRWNGEPLDSESGLTYMRNRYYHPSTGRFIQRDPIGYAGGLNLYSFAAGDPINLADPDGLIPQAIVDEVRGTSPNQGASSEAILGTAAAMIPGVDEATTAYDISENGLQWYHGAAVLPLVSLPLVKSFLRPTLRGPAGRQSRGGFARIPKPKKKAKKRIPPGQRSSAQVQEAQENLHKVRDKYNSEGRPAMIENTGRTDTDAAKNLRHLQGADALKRAEDEFE